MFAWFSEEKRLERQYRKKREEAERVLKQDADRARYAELLAEAEALGDRLEALRAAG